MIGDATISKGNCFSISQGGFKTDTLRKYGEHVVSATRIEWLVIQKLCLCDFNHSLEGNLVVIMM